MPLSTITESDFVQSIRVGKPVGGGDGGGLTADSSSVSSDSGTVTVDASESVGVVHKTREDLLQFINTGRL